MPDTFYLQEVLPPYLHIIFNPKFVVVLVVILLVLTLVNIFTNTIRFIAQFKQKHTFLEVIPPYNNIQSIVSTQYFFTVTHSLLTPRSIFEKVLKVKKLVSCELVSSKEDGIRYILKIPQVETSAIKKNLRAHIPGIEIKEVNDYLSDKHRETAIQDLQLSRSFFFPLTTNHSLEQIDPISYISHQMTQLDPGELIAVQYVLTPLSETTHSYTWNKIYQLRQAFANNKNIEKVLNDTLIHKILSFLDTNANSLRKVGTSRQNLYTSVEQKIDQPLFEVAVRTLICANNKQFRDFKREGLFSTFQVFNNAYQSFKVDTFLQNFPPYFRHAFFKLRLHSLFTNSFLSVNELSVLYHFPNMEAVNVEDLVKIKSPQLPSPLHLKQAQEQFDISFARNTYGEIETPIGLTLEERRRHMYVIGATGTGKTTLLTHMLYQDMINGKGLAILDPHGDLAEKLLGLIPENRLQDVVFFNPYDIEHSVGLNVLEMSDNLSKTDTLLEKDLITSNLISVFHKLYPARYSGPRMEHVLRNTVLTALETHKPTLFTVYKLLTNKNYRKTVVSKLTDPILKDFWDQEFNELGSYQKAELISPITNKLGRFLTTKITRNILNQEQSKLDFEHIMNNKKILICNLSKGRIGEDTSSFLGSLLIAKLQLTAFKRVHIGQDKREDFFIYIDEFQNFATLSFAQILSESRKYRLNTILAHQTISQIEDKDLLKVILANVGTVISFRTSNPSDESIILPLLTPQVKKNEISNLPSYNFYIKINALSPEDAFTGSVNDFTIQENKDSKEKIISYSRNTYGTEIEKGELSIEDIPEAKLKKTATKITKKVEKKRVTI